MASQIFDIKPYQPTSTEKFFFDANIWIYLLCPLGNYRRHIIAEYDSFLKKIIENKSSLFVSSLIISEFFNRYMRLEFKLWKDRNSSNKDYADFKKTEDYRSWAAQASWDIKYKMLKVAKKIDDKFSALDTEQLFDEIENSDFNDNYYLDLCLMENMIIVSNDGNMPIKKINCPFLTGNPRLLARRNS